MIRKTYITRMPDRAGAFLLAGRIISETGGNIVRVNYNRAVDTHTLFIDASGTSEQLDSITVRYFDPETITVQQTQMYIDGFKAKLEKDTSYKGLWTVSFTLKEF